MDLEAAKASLSQAARDLGASGYAVVQDGLTLRLKKGPHKILIRNSFHPTKRDVGGEVQAMAAGMVLKKLLVQKPPGNV